MTDREKSILTQEPLEVARMFILFSIGALAGARGILLHVLDTLPLTPKVELRQMRAGEIPWDLPASLRRDVDHAIGHKIEEALAELQSAVNDTEESLAKRWEDNQG